MSHNEWPFGDWVYEQLVKTLADLPDDLPTGEGVVKETRYDYGEDNGTNYVSVTLTSVADGLKVVIGRSVWMFPSVMVDPKPGAALEMAEFLSERCRGSKPNEERTEVWSFIMPWPRGTDSYRTQTRA